MLTTIHSHKHTRSQVHTLTSTLSYTPVHPRSHTFAHVYVHVHPDFMAYTLTSTLPYILALAFSVHSFIAGLSFGLQHTMDGALAVLIAIFAHKAIEALAVGSNFIREGIRWKTAAPVILTYSLMTPAGEAM